jgi:hypothetical protein
LDKHPEEMMPKNPDPRDLGPKPPFPEQKQSHPGTVKRLNPPADHGENRYVRTGRLLGQAAIITGADSGIGRATAIAFAKEGADIVLSYLPEEEADALDVSVVIHETGRKAIRHPGDIGSLEYAKTLVAIAIKEFGRIDIVVNNAGFQMTHDKIEETRRRIRAYISDQRLRNVLPHPGSTAKDGAGWLDYQHNFNSGI